MGEQVNILLKDRDVKMMLDIYYNILLDTNHFAEMYFSHTNNPFLSAYKRLEKLAHPDIEYLKKQPILYKLNARARAQNGYTLGKRGLEVIESLGIKVDWNRKWLDAAPTTFKHGIEIAEFYRVLKKRTENTAAFEIEDWLTDRRSRFVFNQNNFIKPDATIVLLAKTQEKEFRFTFLLEWERTRHSQIDLERKLNNYFLFAESEEYKNNYYFKLSNLNRVIFIANEERTKLKTLFNKLDNSDLNKVMDGIFVTSRQKALENPLGNVWKALGKKYDQHFQLWSKLD